MIFNVLLNKLDNTSLILNEILEVFIIKAKIGCQGLHILNYHVQNQAG